MKGVVEADRKIHKQYKDALPVTRRFDEGEPSKTKIQVDKEVLMREGELLVKWLASKGELGLVESKEALECSDKSFKIVNKEIPLPTDNFEKLREDIAKHAKRSDVPTNFGEFKSWASENQIVETLKVEAKSGLEEKIRSGLELIDREILESWYKIDASKLYNNKSVHTHSRGDVDLGDESNGSSPSESSDEKRPRKIARSESFSGDVQAHDMRGRFESQESSTIARSLSAEPGTRARARKSNSKNSSDRSRLL